MKFKVGDRALAGVVRSRLVAQVFRDSRDSVRHETESRFPGGAYGFGFPALWMAQPRLGINDIGCVSSEELIPRVVPRETSV